MRDIAQSFNSVIFIDFEVTVPPVREDRRFFIGKSHPAVSATSSFGEERGQTAEHCLRLSIEQSMNRTAPWSKWDSFFAALRKRLSD